LHFADVGKIRKMLDRQPATAFDDGVTHMVADIEHWREGSLWQPESIAFATRTWLKHMRGPAL
jgi:UDP-glucose 4-epimerase